MNFKGTNKVQAAMETVLVASTNTTPTGALVGATTAFNITNGQLGVLSFDLDGTPALGTFMSVANSATSTNKAVKIVQGTPKSGAIHTADAFEVGDKALVESDIIYHNAILDYQKTPASVGQLSLNAVTAIGTPVADKIYTTYLRLSGVRNDRNYSDNDEVIYEQVTTPVSLTGITNVKDWVLQNLIAKLNSRSKLVGTTNDGVNRAGNKDYIVLGIKTTAGSGTVINAVATGSTLNVQTVNGVTTVLPVTAQLVSSLARLVVTTAVAGTATIETVDLSTAGDAAKIDAFIVVGLDADLSVVYDDIAQVRTTVEINPGEEFINIGFTKTKIDAREAVGFARVEQIGNRHRAQLRVHTMQNTPCMDFFSEGVSYIQNNTWYNSAIVHFYNYEETITVRPRYEMRTTLLWPATPATNTTVATAVTAIGASTPIIVFTSTEPTAVSVFEAWVNRADVFVNAGDGIEVTGTGSAATPYVITVE